MNSIKTISASCFCLCKGKSASTETQCLFPPHKVFIQMLINLIFPSFSLPFAHGLSALLCHIPLLLLALLLCASCCFSSQHGLLMCCRAEQRGWSREESCQHWKRQCCASIPCHIYVHWLSRGALDPTEPLQLGVTACQQRKEGAPGPGTHWFMRAAHSRWGLSFLFPPSLLCLSGETLL